MKIIIRQFIQKFINCTSKNCLMNKEEKKVNNIDNNHIFSLSFLIFICLLFIMIKAS
jgi:hypothetical protein